VSYNLIWVFIDFYGFQLMVIDSSNRERRRCVGCFSCWNLWLQASGSSSSRSHGEKNKRALEGAPIAGICGWRHPCQYEDSFKEAARKMKEFWEVSELLESVVGGIQAGINNSLGLL
jgi:hypothetical protein